MRAKTTRAALAKTTAFGLGRKALRRWIAMSQLSCDSTRSDAPQSVVERRSTRPMTGAKLCVPGSWSGASSATNGSVVLARWRVVPGRKATDVLPLSRTPNSLQAPQDLGRRVELHIADKLSLLCLFG